MWLYTAAYYMIIYSFMGWCMEVAYHTLTFGKFANRGFLYGPVCPLYGVGAVTVIYLFAPLKDNLILLFLASALITTSIELVTGMALDYFFKSKWWDYSNIPFNYKGYICLKFSVIWGLVCVFAIRVIHPGVALIVEVLPRIAGIIILVILYLIFLLDIILTVFEMSDFKKQLKLADKLSSDLYSVSDALGMKINNSVLKGLDFKEGTSNRINSIKSETRQKYEKVKEDISEQEAMLRSKYSLVLSRYKSNIERITKRHKRLIRAFPSMKSKIGGSAVEIIKERIGVLNKKLK